MLEVSGRQRDLDEPCECGGRDGEREGEMKRKKERAKVTEGNRWRKVRQKHFRDKLLLL